MTKTLTIAALIILGLFCLSVEAQRNKLQNIELMYGTFKGWVGDHNHKFGIEEMYFRFSNWKNNLDFVREHNAKDLPFKLEMNEFAHLSPEEFSALHLGFDSNMAAQMRDANQVNTVEALGDADSNSTDADEDANDDIYDELPASIDWRNKGAVTAVANQGMCGGCWAFSAIGALEGLNAINSTKLSTFSKQQLLDCSADYGNMGCNGGMMDAAFNYTSAKGVQLESDYPYTSINGSNVTNATNATNDTNVTNATNAACIYNASQVAFKNAGFKVLPGNNSLELKLAVSKQPVSIAIEANSLVLQLFKEGVLTTGCGLNLDHGVLIVGYDTMVDGTEYWIVKNSWSSRWGMNGYFNIAMGQQNDGAGVCGMNIYNTFPTL